MKNSKNIPAYGIKFIPILLIFINTGYVYADHDTSLRTDLNFSYTFNEQYKSVSYIFLQADKDISNLDYLEWGTGLQYQTPVKWLSFLLYYQQGFSKVEPDNWLLEQRPSINMNTLNTLCNFKISNQIRYEYRFTPDWNDYRIKYSLEISRPDIFLQPYIGWELYYENRDKALMLSRTKFGIIKNVGSRISIGPYYRIDFSNIDHKWEWTRQLIGIQLTLKY
ncbi:MAG: hypothetical protein CVU55_02865 [Deltaproteobacteria bacterium HGW-Deltaproteobacteria-13]|jgi:hypothetical protein|nr:MAG: hypothetical protein CVU55_02865 [Deltaproteobacteria bacterium HGW-Deltaproteobacteria-13]